MFFFDYFWWILASPVSPPPPHVCLQYVTLFAKFADCNPTDPELPPDVCWANSINRIKYEATKKKIWKKTKISFRQIFQMIIYTASSADRVIAKKFPAVNGARWWIVESDGLLSARISETANGELIESRIEIFEACVVCLSLTISNFSIIQFRLFHSKFLINEKELFRNF